MERGINDQAEYDGNNRTYTWIKNFLFDRFNILLSL